MSWGSSPSISINLSPVSSQVAATYLGFMKSDGSWQVSRDFHPEAFWDTFSAQWLSFPACKRRRYHLSLRSTMRPTDTPAMDEHRWVNRGVCVAFPSGFVFL